MPASPPPTIRQFYCVTAGPPFKEFNVQAGPPQTALDGIDIPYGISISPATTSPQVVTEGVISDPGLGPFTFYVASSNRMVFCAPDGSLTQDKTLGYRPVGMALGPNTMVVQLRNPTLRTSAANRPIVISDGNPYPMQANGASDASAIRTFIGLGGTDNLGVLVARDVVVEYVDDAHVKIKMKGDDGTTRSVTLTVT